MLARFFIDRPIFAWVLSIVIVLGGGFTYFLLPVAQYPEITPPTVQVTCTYPGASAVVVRDTVAAPIEQQINGVENMLYMSSQSTNDGGYNLTVTFALGTNLDMAQVLVQNRVSQALPTLPDVVKATGVIVKKKSPSILLVVNLYSENDPNTKQPYFDQLYMSNYATLQVKDELARLQGVGDVAMLGQQDYSLRVWLNPEKLSSRKLTADDVNKALREQNVQVAAGQLGQPPVPTGLQFQYTLTTLGRLLEVEDFERIIIKTGSKGEITRLMDVARVELGAKNQDVRCRLDGRPSVGMPIYQLPGSNALETADHIRTKMAELEKRFPKGLKYEIVYDTTPFIQESIDEVIKTLRDAIILVAIVVLLFLQDWRVVMLPLIDVAVSLIGTFLFLALFGFTLNNLTLLGLVLAIGIVVDDAIVVLENIEVWLAKGYPLREATIGAMNEITGPVIAITLVLSSVLLPSAFLSGITGQFYRQFALTIAASMILSAVNALTMTPARAGAVFGHRKPGEHTAHEALPWWGVVAIGGYLTGWVFASQLAPLFGIHPHEHHGAISFTWGQRGIMFIPGAIIGYFAARPLNRVLSIFFGAFNTAFDAITKVYGRTVAGSLRVSFIVLIVYGGLLGLTVLGFKRVPFGFIPSQDKGYLLVNIQLPDAASLERTSEVVEQVERIAKDMPGVAHTIGIPGQSFLLNAVSSNYASMFVVLKPFHDRKDPAMYADVIAQNLRRECYVKIQEAQVSVFGAPAVDGLGNAGGFKLMVQDRSDSGLAMLEGQSDNLAEKGRAMPGFVGLFSSFRSNTPQLYLDVDRTKCKTMGIELNEVFSALQTYLGGYYVNDFNKFGRTWQVNVQADAPFRITQNTIKRIEVRNRDGQMVPLGAVVAIRDSAGPVLITRYNMYTAATINGATLPGVSTGEVISRMEELSKKELAPSMSVEWTELSYLQKESSKTPTLTELFFNTSKAIKDLLGNPLTAFVGGVILVYLILAAQYESWGMPLSVILVVPMCLLCALAGVAIARLDINIFVQIGFVVLVGLAAKNAILIVEFARERVAEGMDIRAAAIQACTARLRPIIMTSFAFVLGVVPLMIAKGAGAEMRQSMGVAVFYGMLGVTFFGIYLTPVFYFLIQSVIGVPQKPVTQTTIPPSGPTQHSDPQGIAAPHSPPPAGH